MKNKLLSFILALLLIVFGLPVTGKAAGTPQYTVQSQSVTTGDTFTMAVSIAGNPGIISMRFTVSYDATVLELVKVDNTGLLAGYTTPSPTISSPYTLRWTDSLATEDNTAQGTVAVLTFKALKYTPSTSVTITHTEARNASGTKISFANASATVTVACNHSYGAWSKADDTNHSRACSFCQNPETAAHDWKAGAITKQPSCKEAGSQTYNCATCGGTKTVPLDKTENHSYGNWTKVNDSTHKHICSVCQKEETANHSWDSGKETKKATCKETGVKTFTCTGCSATRTEDIPKTTVHSYGNWTKADNATHKHTCSVCQKEETASHSWDSGKETKKATCKETGVKTFTCTGCSATKTEDTPKTTTHTYGRWTKVDNNTHKHSCSICGKEETANHSWNSGAVTKTATCKEAGVKTYTCTGCGVTKTEEIAKTTTHTYDHACDTDCNVCGVTRTTTHSYKADWSKDQSNHWHECSVCKNKKDLAAHTPGTAPTETAPQICTTCGYIIRPALGHTHSYANTWTTDDNGHWYTCSGCAEKGSYADHDFENACDPDCSICGYARETDHTYEENWESDETNHWHVCTGCELKADEAAHEPGAEATATTAQTCTICGYEIAPALGVPETEPTATVDVSEKPTEKSGFPWWVLIAAVLVLGGGTAFFILKKKKK